MRRTVVKLEELDELDISILTHMAEGLTNKEIGAAVHLAPDTVKNRISAIGEYFGNGQRTAIVATALRRHIIE